MKRNFGRFIFTNEGEHENHKQRDQEDVADGFHGNDDALDEDVLGFGAKIQCRWLKLLAPKQPVVI